ncbi:hypothetical protein Shyhy01_57820 [Streptomyces hygroscopicus subsp. hygroscopicus]|uniref:condensation domain-containing protein n=1 Tax=Streptomyces sp. KHY 26 TaxID=3097359 RepID=UPI0024A5D3FF|nr:condensation domain-containing protein [Streptomyces hygroscopicus]GLX52832.1 hypothetical protein Shyhy01_57820 [Streptomyces hygroscopicus subsp. hygroscopicus]
MPSPLTPAQRGLLVSLLYGGGPVAPELYHLQLVLRLTGRLDAARLRSAAEALLRRTPTLRTGFAHADSQGPVARVTGPEQALLPWQEADLQDLPADKRDDATERLTLSERTTPFCLDRPPLLRMLLVRTGDNRHILVLTHHHLVCDGWSQHALVRELFKDYAGSAAPSTSPNATRDQRDRPLRDPEHEKIWRTVLADASPLLLSPTGASAGELPVPVRLMKDAGEGLAQRLTVCMGELGVTLDAVVQGAWAVQLAQLTGRDTIIAGGLATPWGSSTADTDGRIGALATLQPLPVHIRADRSWRDLLTGIQQRLDTLAPTSATLGAADIQQLTGAGPLFDTAAVVEHPPVTPEDIAPLVPNLRLDSAQGYDTNHYAASFSVVPGNRLILRLDHRSGALGMVSPERLLDALHRTLEEIADQPDRSVGLLSLSDADTASGTDTLPITSETFTLSGQVARLAAARPSAIAVSAPEGDLTYGELDAAVEQLARRLVQAGAGQDDVVALVLPAYLPAGETSLGRGPQGLGLGYPEGAAILLSVLLLVFLGWKLSGTTFRITEIVSFRGEALFWTAILVSNTLGTSMGDFLSDSSGLGYAGGAALVTGALLVLVALTRVPAVPNVLLFWTAFVLTRPLGATAGDLLTKPVAKGGLDLGTAGSSAVLLMVLFGLMAHQHATRTPRLRNTGGGV